MDKHSIIKFPCLFSIKIIGLSNTNLVAEIIPIISSYCHEFNPDTNINIKPSTKDKYMSITATIVAQSKEQLDNIYLALNKHELVKITL